MTDRMVDTVYGPLPGCPDCGVIPLRGPHICEHGVTPAPALTVEFTATIEDREAYDRLTGQG